MSANNAEVSTASPGERVAPVSSFQGTLFWWVCKGNQNTTTILEVPQKTHPSTSSSPNI